MWDKSERIVLKFKQYDGKKYIDENYLKKLKQNKIIQENNKKSDNDNSRFYD